jgi:hypothetical protein
MAITPDSLFALANPVAMIGWVLLIIAPRWSLTRRVVLSGALPLVPTAC